MTTDTRFNVALGQFDQLVRLYHYVTEELSAERARSAKLVEALEKIHGWHWQHNSPAELKGWADEALESYRAEDGK